MIKLVCVLVVCLVGFVSGTGETSNAHFESKADFSSCAFEEQTLYVKPPRDVPRK